MNFTIKNAVIAVTDGYRTIDVQVVNGIITAIDSNLDLIGTRINGENKLLLSGFFNAHTHSSEKWQRGVIPPLPLELWLAHLYEFAPLDTEQVYISALGTAVETLLSGGTSVVDHLVLIPGKELETIATAVRAYREIGIRAFVAPLIQDESLSAGIPSGESSQIHEPYFRSTAETLVIIEEAVRLFHRPDEGINILVAPTGIQLCSDALFTGCVELSNRYNLCRHSHLLETKAQEKLAQEKYGCTAVEHLQRIGYLSDRTSLAHCVWLTDSDINILAETQATVVHNPLSNLRLGSGIAPILKYRQAGVNVTFGCDGASSNDSQDLLEAIKIGSILHNVTELDYQYWITPREAVEMASLGGAKGLNMDDQLGSLTVGKQADLVLYDLTNLSLLPRTDPIGLLVLGRPTNAVDSAWVRGKQIIADGKVTTINVDELRQELFNRSEWGKTHRSKSVGEMEVHYRQVMGL
ncbi:amidohydrolase [Anabaena cylindrica FACHB-243]|uniref:S-adenosylhomocysteine deaminase n=1 Tax=Anabaena cylindrica (strain ATCC 27899 / PCC 7122) TaxID=272123 RepID=K9ZJS8_ANACC|nr:MULTISPECIES: amidohydrolase [Anabaena]AFZ58787.1 S-adenosylhomocysteine deaminase [Anabaena cylindrica PCC 7122]MBD2420128.1 amidohydrolase [Anabaena cylindrica FACHB-243]MBY5285358.1 amidohydrolase [Anabaena sp. CCAP 1446/1C]MBY5306601.1 amidohydrolase [Anabaena sp. CCAP 1446/1C]MCM2406974.1 amidohydrolase [Anabaena sp. CCAP 1446/1C]